MSDCLSSFIEASSLPDYEVIRKHVVVLGAGIASVFAVFKAYQYLKNRKKSQRREKWAKVGKDKVVLHQFSRGGVAPSASPFPLKLETYLRMANIPYECDFEEPFGPKGKTPWITINGEDMADSQLCLEFLAAKFQKNFSSHLTPLELATARAFQIMCEEHLFWPLVLWRFVYTKGKTVPHVMPSMPQYVIPFAAKLWTKAAHGQGMGRHSEVEATEMAVKDLRAISIYLGTKPYFTGDKPTEVDCAFFGMLTQVVWAAPGSCFEQLVNGEFVNLKQFCERMKSEFWPDWNECLYHRS